MANRYGTPKNENEQISVGHFCGKHAMKAKKNGILFLFLFFLVCVCLVATYEIEDHFRR